MCSARHNVNMPTEMVPLFPLGVVLFPNTMMPLHIFEERYKQMIGKALREQSEFGIVQAGEKGIVNSGCTASIDKVLQTYDDGRMDIIAMGRRRFEIISLNDELDYLRAEIEYFGDDPEGEAPRELRDRAVSGFSLIRTSSEIEVKGEPDVDDPQLSFQLAQVINDLDFRQTLLATRSETERLRRFAEFIPQFLVRQKHAKHVKSVAPQNGHAKVKLI